VREPTAEKRDKSLIGTNRKARRDYEVLETIEAGLVLTGTEVKSLRARRVNMGDAYATFEDGGFFLVHLHISPYEQGNRVNHDPLRRRKLLLHRRQIEKLRGRIETRGLTIVPLELYFSGPYAKVLLALARGRNYADRRQDLAKREADREIRRRVREASR
jgi:SsrA-binding protein